MHCVGFQSENELHTRYYSSPHKALNGMAPKYIVDLLQYYTSTRQLRSSSKNLLVLPKSNLKYYGDRSFQVAAPKLWNALPARIRSIPSILLINESKKEIKTLLFSLTEKPRRAFCHFFKPRVFGLFISYWPFKSLGSS